MSAYEVSMELAPAANLGADPSTWSWQDYTDKVWMPDKIARQWGKQDRFPNAGPAKLAMTLINDGGLFVPDNPVSPLYGLIDENTPIRVLVAPRENSFSDDFNRTASSAWNNGWTISGGTAPDYSVSPTSGGRHTHAAVNTPHWSTQAVGLQRIDVTVRVRVNATSTGAAQSAGVVCRYTDSSNSRRAEVQFGTSGALTARLVSRTSGTDTPVGSATVAGLTHSTSAWYRIRLQAGADDCRMKVWLDGQPQPRSWTVDGASGAVFASPVAGAAGCYSRRETGNTNANATIDFDDFSLLDGPYELHTCHVDEWPTEWSDASGNQSLARITASGRLRLLQEARPLRSAIYRDISRSPTVVAYWSMEDKSSAPAFASGLSGGPSAFYSDLSLAADSDVVGSEPLPTFGTNGRLACTVPPYTFSGTWAVCWVMKIPASSISGSAQIMSWTTPGATVGRWQLTLDAGPPISIQLVGFNSSGGGTVSGTALLFLNSTPITDGRQLYFQVNGQQNGGNVDITWTVSYISDDGMTLASPGSTNSFAGTTTRVGLIYHDSVTGFGGGGHTIGHVGLGDGDVAFGASTTGVTGGVGETTQERGERLSGEERIPFRFGEVSTGVTTQQMGQQGIATLYQHLQQIESTESGILCDGRQGHVTIVPRSARYNRAVDMVIDLDSGEMGWPWRRTRDTQAMTTEVTASSPTGSTVIASAPDSLIDRVGIKPQQITVNAYRDIGLADHAAWWLSLGVSRKGRYPQVPLQLHRATGLIRAYLGMGHGGRIQVTNLPGELPPDDLELVAEGGQDVIDPFEWLATLNASDGSPWLVAVLNDANKRLDCGASTTSGTLTTTATSVALNIADQCTWTHARGDFDIVIAGERMTVTGVTTAVGSGSSWTQTLTVTRSVNGVIKTHAAGESVRVAEPIILAL